MSKIGFVGDKMRFSERYGYQPIREIIQKNSINTDLKNALWNTIIVCIFTLYTTNFTEPLSYQDSAFLKLPKFP